MGTTRPPKQLRPLKPLTILAIVSIVPLTLAIAITVTVLRENMHIDKQYCSLPDRDHRPYDAEAAPYRGDGPHPILILHSESTVMSYGASEIPPGWMTGSVEELQLVACGMSVTEQVDGTCVPIGQQGPSEPSYNRIYEFDVIEAATGRELGSFTVGSAGGCGSDASRTLNEADLVANLRRFVEGPVS